MWYLAVLHFCLGCLSYLLLEYSLQIKNFTDGCGEGQLVGEMVVFSCMYKRPVMGFVMKPNKVNQVWACETDFPCACMWLIMKCS